MRETRRIIVGFAALALLGSAACQGESLATLPEATETFNQVAAAQADILWVVDNSESMLDEQTKLSQNFAAFIRAIEESSIQYQMGVITTEGGNGPNAGALQGDPKIITPGAQAETFFRNNIQVGTEGGALETGIEAAYRALTEPRLSGANAGFIRPNAALLLIFVSDEDDGSFGKVRFYARFLEALKGPGSDSLVSVSAIVGDDDGPLPGGGRGCTSNEGGDFQTAVWGERYEQLARETGGQAISICDRDFASSLGRLGIQATGLRNRFRLDGTPVGDAIVSVTVNGRVLLVPDWNYDPVTNEIIFSPDATPPPGAEILVTYRV